eukprot:COSAG04_NODE_341_length_16294_cov_8.682618_12_plen_101_part_00
MIHGVELSSVEAMLADDATGAAVRLDLQEKKRALSAAEYQRYMLSLIAGNSPRGLLAGADPNIGLPTSILRHLNCSLPSPNSSASCIACDSRSNQFSLSF